MAKPDKKTLISGVTFVRNAVKFDYPQVEAVRSILPIVDEYVLLVCESEDDTLSLARSIDNPKLGIYESDWDETLREGGHLTRDARMKERKKYGLHKARKGTQFSKR